jgi:hypothetical protein
MAEGAAPTLAALIESSKSSTRMVQVVFLSHAGYGIAGRYGIIIGEEIYGAFDPRGFYFFSYPG